LLTVFLLAAAVDHFARATAMAGEVGADEIEC
jgi:hypothetical protein